jgi:quinol monooxygenase YgiN
MYAVVVTFEIEPSQMDEFMSLMLDNASTSLADEAACKRFDVCSDPGSPNEVYLYELYDDRAGFDIHLASAHFKAFDAKVAPMISTKQVRTYEKVVS